MVRFESGEASLVGVAWSADTRVALPGVVLVGGSGPTDRTNGGYFCALRDHLVAAGMTVFAYDKRGVGQSTGAYSTADAEELAADVAAAVETLRAHSAVDPHAVGVFGHSEGGWVALRAARRMRGLRCLVLNSCPAVSFVDAEVSVLERAGADPDQARALFDRLRQAIQAGAGFEVAARAIEEAADPVMRRILAHAGFRLTGESYSQLQAWIDYAPDDDLLDLQIPTLAIYGGDDAVTPVLSSLHRLAKLAPLTRTQVFAGADHRLQINQTLAAGYLDLVAGWCTSPDATLPRPPRQGPPTQPS